jgi:hypothetical protein
MYWFPGLTKVETSSVSGIGVARHSVSAVELVPGMSLHCAFMTPNTELAETIALM